MNVKLPKFFRVIAERKTYFNLFYLLLSFPLGIFYFVFLITGLSLGFGLIITWFGIPILFGALLLGRVFAVFERQQAKMILGIDIPYVPLKLPKGIWNRVKAYLADPFTWKSMAYILIKFPLGIISFVFLVTFLSVSLALIATPFGYYLLETGAVQGTFCSGPDIVCSFMDSYPEVIFIGIIGILLLLAFLHFLNGLAGISGFFAKSMLEKKK